MPPAKHMAFGSLCLMAALSAGIAHAQDENTVPRLESTDCATQALKDLNASCYTFYGQENWNDPNGQTIELPIGVIAPESSNGNDADSDPVIFFPGGPGYSILDNVDYIEQLRKDIGDRSLVVFDPRGFKHATPALECSDYANVSPYHNIIHTPALTASLDPMDRMQYITDEVSACYQKLDDEGVEIAQYNEWATSRDLDEIRNLLDYENVNIFGSSTGSGTALSYVRYYPDSVKSAILGWPWYTSLRNRAPLDEFYTLKRRFTDVLAMCVEDSEACREQVPAWFLAIDRTRRALDEKPFIAQVESEGEQETLYFDGAAFLDTLYLMLPQYYDLLPRIVSEVPEGNYSTLNDFFMIDQYQADTDPGGYAMGAFLAQACNDMGTNRPTPKDSMAAVQREPAIIGFEPIWLCAWWGEDGDVPPEHNDIVTADTPALAIHGQMDPCCGTRWSDELADTMPNLQAIEMQAMGHSPVNECRSTVINEFLGDPLAPIDTSCKNEVPLAEWQLE
ncbi:alpha/beta hydrolase [Halomonas sp. MC140]|nr:alpha/beta hydrolase [Halomonas sp. MC140]MDN7131771.1 alpha/beta hydrolase [Halomonas sp. MC140]